MCCLYDSRNLMDSVDRGWKADFRRKTSLSTDGHGGSLIKIRRREMELKVVGHFPDLSCMGPHSLGKLKVFERGAGEEDSVDEYLMIRNFFSFSDGVTRGREGDNLGG